ncbi:poly-gamma-glutamate synthase PgsB [Salipaludibacillus aurantiacus]|uniref:Poly-gamma-glutamate synthase PgsB/CapB n=1 Tax=Salipaludibacillus aurantiacus TaxID=1601833 RepID=A0A1H9VE87_9BACI|nr:poly-gamma-glutamate synthase PgsB [Salipaludibacillus aurantiacus]SES20110.1 poly-gamma-glutamate synthase PgsB/CapB [Salipaludibacillus aurantiacus]
MYLIPLSVIIILTLAVIERIKHQKNVESIPIRININGVRGKSTVTRLVTGIVKEAGYKTIGKTTGTSARMIYWDTPEEKPILRDPEGPNIKEQKRVVQEAADRGAEALVSECMAVNPDYQNTFQTIMLQANIGVIVNVLEDHMDMLGPSLDDVAESFISTIPYNGKLIVNDSPYVSFYLKEAEKRKTKLIVADASRITEDFLRQFPYVIFPENAALALAVAEALQIDEETARRGMLNAQPDPGALRIEEIESDGKKSPFVNAFAANDAHSTLSIWRRVEQLGYETERPVVIMNCREDRVDRTEQFARDVLPEMKISVLVLIGESVGPIIEAVGNGSIQPGELVNMEGKSVEEAAAAVKQRVSGDVMFGIGNIHGAAEELLAYLKDSETVEAV